MLRTHDTLATARASWTIALCMSWLLLLSSLAMAPTAVAQTGDPAPAPTPPGEVDPKPAPPDKPELPKPELPKPELPKPELRKPELRKPGLHKPNSPVQSEASDELTAAEIPNQRYPIAWRKNMRLAQEEARVRNVPILLVVLRDGDRICEATRSSLWPQREYAEAVDDECVPIVIVLPPASGDPPHEEIAADPAKGTEAHCPVVPGQRCAEHIAMTLRVKREWRVGDGALPERRFISAEGVVLAEPKDLPPGMNVDRFRAALPAVREALGERRTTRIQYRFALVRLDRMAKKVADREYKEACLDLRAIRREEASLPTPILERANEIEALIRTEAKRHLERARKIEETSSAGAMQIYKMIFNEFPGMPEAEIAQKKLSP